MLDHIHSNLFSAFHRLLVYLCVISIPFVSLCNSLYEYRLTTVDKNGDYLIRLLSYLPCSRIDDSLNILHKSSVDGINICDIVASKHKNYIDIRGERIFFKNRDIKKIAVIGDTGCRTKLGIPFQNHLDIDDWPFAEVIASISMHDPDLVIHVGDYLYFDSCVNSDFCFHKSKTIWKQWEFEFFNPANKLLKKSTWIFVRGNHEACKSHGDGWFKFLENSSEFTGCRDSYSLQDISYSDLFSFKVFDINGSPDQEVHFGEKKEDTRFSFLLCHIPIFTNYKAFFRKEKRSIPMEIFNLANQSDIILSGHIHAFQYFDLIDGPLQLVAGNGGTLLNAYLEGIFSGNKKIKGKGVNSSKTISGTHGFSIIDVTDDQLNISAYSYKNELLWSNRK